MSSFKKTSIDEINRIQASNVKKSLQDRVISEKIGEQVRTEQLEKQYAPLVGLLGVQTDEPAKIGDLSRDGKKVVRLSDLMNDVLTNIRLGNDLLVTANPAYVDAVSTPNIPPTLNISQLSANTFERLREVRDNLGFVRGNTDKLVDQLSELGEVIAETKMDEKNLSDVLDDVFYTVNGGVIENTTVPVILNEFESIAKNARIPLTNNEISLVGKRLQSILEDNINVTIDASLGKGIRDAIISSIKVDDRKTLSKLVKIDKSLGNLIEQDKDLGDKLADIPEGLASVMKYLPEAIAERLEFTKLAPEEKVKRTTTAKTIAAATPQISREVEELWKKPPEKNTYDLVKTDITKGDMIPGYAYKSIGNDGGFVRVDTLIGDNPHLVLYNKDGERDLRTPDEGVVISTDFRDILVNSDAELKKTKKGYAISGDELNLVVPYFTNLTSTSNDAKLRFLRGHNTKVLNRNAPLFRLTSQITNPITAPPTLGSVIREVVPPVGREVSPPKTRGEQESAAALSGKPSKIREVKRTLSNARIEPPKKGNGYDRNNGYYGRVWINPDKLGIGKLSVYKVRTNVTKNKSPVTIKYKLPYDVGQRAIFSAEVDSDFIDLLTKKFNKKRKYSKHAIETFRKLSEIAGVHQENIGNTGKKELLLKGVYDEIDNGKIVKIITDPNELIDRMAILVGSIEGGNTNPLLRDELGQITDILRTKKMISGDEHQIIFEKYISG